MESKIFKRRAQLGKTGNRPDKCSSVELHLARGSSARTNSCLDRKQLSTLLRHYIKNLSGSVLTPSLVLNLKRGCARTDGIGNHSNEQCI